MHYYIHLISKLIVRCQELRIFQPLNLIKKLLWKNESQKVYIRLWSFIRLYNNEDPGITRGTGNCREPFLRHALKRREKKKSKRKTRTKVVHKNVSEVCNKIRKSKNLNSRNLSITYKWFYVTLKLYLILSKIMLSYYYIVFNQIFI